MRKYFPGTNKRLEREFGGQPSHHFPTSKDFRKDPLRRWIERQTPVNTAF
jgi:hypothetical protein